MIISTLFFKKLPFFFKPSYNNNLMYAIECEYGKNINEKNITGKKKSIKERMEWR